MPEFLATTSTLGDILLYYFFILGISMEIDSRMCLYEERFYGSQE